MARRVAARKSQREVKLEAPVKAVLVESFEASRGKPGSFYYVSEKGSEKPVSIWARCPCGCDKSYMLNIDEARRGEAPTWKWDGNREAPTLEPSIHDRTTKGGSGTHWHGWLRKGEWVQA